MIFVRHRGWLRTPVESNSFHLLATVTMHFKKNVVMLGYSLKYVEKRQGRY